MIKKTLSVVIRILGIAFLSFGAIFSLKESNTGLFITSCGLVFFVMMSLAIDFAGIKKNSTDFMGYCLIHFIGLAFTIFVVISGFYFLFMPNNRVYVDILSFVAVIGGSLVMMIVLPSFIVTVYVYLKTGEFKIRKPFGKK